MLLRIEDTDVERSRQHHAEQIVASLTWLGIEWDEGPIFQSDRLDLYRQRAEELVAQGNAYRCFCSVEELDAEREAAEKSGKPYRYSGRCRNLDSAGRENETHIIRFHVPTGQIEFHDLIRGDVEFDGSTIDDFVLLRSDRYPTYHLSVVVDDIDMAITLVARGDDHLSNTPKHVLLFRAFGAEVPRFAHVPLILGSDRKRLSKRTGATSAEEYREMGILPQALFNFLSLLGWSPGGDRELVSREVAEQTFDLSDVQKSPAIFDLEKLLWLNGQYIARCTPEEIVPQLEPFLSFQTTDRGLLLRAIALHLVRARTLRELAEQLVPYFQADDQLPYEDEAVRKHAKGSDLAERMLDLSRVLSEADPFDVETTEAALRALAEERSVSAGRYIHPLRLAVTGKGASPPIFDVLAVLGRERTLNRLRRFIESLPELI